MEAPFMASTTRQSTTFCSYPYETVNNGGASLLGEETFFPLEFQQMNICCVSDTVVVPFSNYPERLGISSNTDVPTLADSTTTLCSFHDGTDSNFGGNIYCNTEACDFGSDCCYDSDFNKPLDLAVQDINWGMQAKQGAPVIEDSSTRVGRYTVEERKDRILRYLKKRNQRNFNKTIKIGESEFGADSQETAVRANMRWRCRRILMKQTLNSETSSSLVMILNR